MEAPLPGDESRFSVAVRDPVWKHIWLTPEFAEIARSAAFLRLYRIKQLGPTEYVYPGASHTRASHSFGVYHVAQRILRALLARGARDWVTEKGANSFLVAALLHDLGHFPFTHSLKELPLADHESLTGDAILREPLKTLIGNAGADPYMTAAIVDKSTNKAIDGETRFFRNLLSGVLDPDKLDYLNRDAYYCGVPYGIQDTDFILSQIEPDKEHGISIPARAIMSIESILFSKYLMYRSVYWHRQVRMATAMMKKTLYAALERNLVGPESLYSQDDSGIFRLIDGLDFPEKEIAVSVRDRDFFRVVAEFPFDGFTTGHARLESLKERAAAENAVAELLGKLTGTSVLPRNVIIDIPEPISFESSLYISDTNSTFSDSPTVFSPDVVSRFTSSLRILRIAVHPSVHEAVSRVEGLTAELAKCVLVG